MADESIKLEDLENFEDQGMKIREALEYQKVTPNFSADDYVCVGEYSDIIYDENPENWTKFWLIGEDIGNGEFYFFINNDKIYLDKGNIMLEESYQDMFKSVMDIVFGEGISHTIDYRGLKN